MLARFKYRNSVLFFFVLGLISCSTLYQKRHSDECRATFEFVKQNWRYDSTLKMYTWGRPVLDTYIWENFNGNCLIGLSKKEVEKVMGKPTEVHNKYCLYKYGPSHMKKTQYYYKLVYDSLPIKLLKIEEMGTHLEIHYEPK